MHQDKNEYFFRKHVVIQMDARQVFGRVNQYDLLNINLLQAQK